MRVAVDARELEGHPTGVGRVLQGLLGAWPIDELALISRRRIGLPPEMVARGATEQIVVEKGAGLPGALWEHLVLPSAIRATNPDALLALGYGMPAGTRVPAAVCMHDCAPFAVPEEFGWRERIRRRWNARHAARNAAFLFMGTEFAATEAQRHLGVGPEKCLVAPWGLTSGFGPVDADEVKRTAEEFGVGSDTILFVGSGFARRGLDALVRRVENLAAHRGPVQLAIAGRGHDADLETSAVRLLGYVAEARLPALYAAAGAVAYPSRYEGFGLPVLEALACGTNVVATDATALDEVFRGKAILVPHDDDDAWAEGLGAALDTDPHPDAVRWARDQQWESTAAAVRQRLLHAVERRS